MPIYQYIAVERDEACQHCKDGFEFFHKTGGQVLKQCPECKEPVRRVFSSFKVGISKSGIDDKAKKKGFHKLKRLGKGEYEKVY